MAAACYVLAFQKTANVTNEALMISPNALYMVEAPQHLVHAQYNKVWAEVADSFYRVPFKVKTIAELNVSA